MRGASARSHRQLRAARTLWAAPICLAAIREYGSAPRRWHREGQTRCEVGTQSHGPRPFAVGVAGLPKSRLDLPARHPRGRELRAPAVSNPPFGRCAPPADVARSRSEGTFRGPARPGPTCAMQVQRIQITVVGRTASAAADDRSPVSKRVPCTGKESRIECVSTEPAVPRDLPLGRQECGKRCGDAASPLSKKEGRVVLRMGTRISTRHPIELMTGTEHIAMGSAAP